jgi:phenylalanyl-tRNA synthetase alpha chain
MNEEAILKQFRDELAAVKDSKALAALKTKYTGKNGSLAELGKGAAALDKAEKRAYYEAFNKIKSAVETELEDTKKKLDESGGGAEVVPFDPTLPGTGRRVGSLHPIPLVQIEIEDIFRSMGFQVFTGDEAVSEYENFDALNIPGDHPARDMQDTFWLKDEAKKWTERMVLRTHTSSMQNRAMKQLFESTLKKDVPLRAIFPGRCFRNETTDMTHENTFYQLEGLYVGRDVTVANLIAVMKELLSRVFHRDDVRVRLRPGFFPFVEPGFELDYWTRIGGKERWLELMPCGMVHPAVLRNGGVDPDVYSGFAFGLGLTRLAMLKFGIPDIRLLNGGDLRFLSQFKATL